jgi:uncharacterized protein
MSQEIAIGLHDVSPLTLTASQKMVACIERTAGGYVPLTLLVIPEHHHRCKVDEASAFRRWVDGRLALGDELALHGLWHRDEGSPRSVLDWWNRRMLSAGEAEFAALDRDEASRRIERGLSLFMRCGWQPCGFVPPAWQASNATRCVLRDLPMLYFTTRNDLRLANGTRARVVPALSLSGRSAWRRFASRHWARHWMRTYVGEPALRLALHPVDMEHLETRRVWDECLTGVLAHARPVKKSELIA